MSLGSIMQRVGGFRGIAAGAAIAWGTAQATAIAEQAQGAAQEAQEALQITLETLQERRDELDRIDADRESILDAMRREVKKEMSALILDGRFDSSVSQRAHTLGYITHVDDAVPAENIDV
jgi:hypothetical protein